MQPLLAMVPEPKPVIKLKLNIYWASTGKPLPAISTALLAKIQYRDIQRNPKTQQVTKSCRLGVSPTVTADANRPD